MSPVSLSCLTSNGPGLVDSSLNAPSLATRACSGSTAISEPVGFHPESDDRLFRLKKSILIKPSKKLDRKRVTRSPKLGHPSPNATCQDQFSKNSTMERRSRSNSRSRSGNTLKRKCSETSVPDTDSYVALDCEFVGVGRRKLSALGRCSIVDFSGRVLCDIYSKPDQPVTDYRTRWSGLRPRDLVNAIPFENARNIVKSHIKDRIVVGHAVHHDFKVLNIRVPFERVRDTSCYKPLRTKAGLPRNETPALKKLAANLLGKCIQENEHCSVEDARATMEVFRTVRDKWESELLNESRRQPKRSRANIDSANSNSASSDDIDDDDDGDNDDDISYLADAFWPDELD